MYARQVQYIRTWAYFDIPVRDPPHFYYEPTPMRVIDAHRGGFSLFFMFFA
jgi:hypothetical protein